VRSRHNTTEEAHVDLQTRRDELRVWLRRLSLVLIDVDRDLIDIATTERQLAVMDFNDHRVATGWAAELAAVERQAEPLPVAAGTRFRTVHPVAERLTR
jgi:hypothetical protein